MTKIVSLNQSAPINHPYLRELENTLTIHKQKMERLELRLTLKHHCKDEWERNEHELLLIDTKGKIQAQKRVVYEREQYYIKFFNQFLLDVEEMEKDYDEVLEKAKAATEKNSTLKSIMDLAKWDIINSDLEQKIAFYKRIKSMV